MKYKKSINNRGYVHFHTKDTHWLEHRYVWTQANGEIPKGMDIDHINGDKTDNRLENLQCITHAKNLQRKNWSKGYTFLSTNKYKAQKKFNNKQHFLGHFGTACGAYMANRMFFIGT